MLDRLSVTTEVISPCLAVVSVCLLAHTSLSAQPVRHGTAHNDDRNYPDTGNISKF